MGSPVANRIAAIRAIAPPKSDQTTSAHSSRVQAVASAGHELPLRKISRPGPMVDRSGTSSRLIPVSRI